MEKTFPQSKDKNNRYIPTKEPRDEFFQRILNPTTHKLQEIFDENTK